MVGCFLDRLRLDGKNVSTVSRLFFVDTKLVYAKRAITTHSTCTACIQHQFCKKPPNKFVGWTPGGTTQLEIQHTLSHHSPISSHHCVCHHLPISWVWSVTAQRCTPPTIRPFEGLRTTIKHQ